MKLPRTIFEFKEYCRKVIAYAASASIVLTPAMSSSLPQGGIVSAGQATIADGVGRVDIHQTTDKAVIDWRGFDLQEGEATQFHQPGNNSLTVNRVNSNSPSIINGSLKANGNVMVINPNGMLFGGKANVDVNGLIASTADGDNASLMKDGKLALSKPGNPNAAIVNQGRIKTKDGGRVGIIAPNISNQGIIEARLGKVQLASGDTATVDLFGDGLIEAAVSDKVKSQLIENNGIISAGGGSIAITAAAGDQIVDSLINLGGVLDARSVGTKTGNITVRADGSNAVKGNKTPDKGKKSGSSNVLVSGILDASGRNAGERGGFIQVLGDNIALLADSFIDASGHTGLIGTADGKPISSVREGSAGGDIRIGGDYLGLGETPTANNLYVDPNAFILNDSIHSGDAGRTIFWSDSTTQFYGNVFARALGGMGVDPITGSAIAGGNPGDGGFVETSGLEQLDAGGYVDLTASNGKRGTYFLDPTNVTIFGNVTSVYNSGNLNGYWNFDEGAGTTAGDTSGNAYNGTLINGAAWSASIAPTPHANANSLQFDGLNDHVLTSTIPGVGSNFSFSLWVNPTVVNQKQVLLSTDIQEYGAELLANGKLNFYTGGGGFNETGIGGSGLSAGTWYNVAGVYNTSTLSLYLNGVLYDSAAAPNAVNTVPTTYKFGQNGTWIGATDLLNGLLDDVRIYNTNLSANDVAELYGSRFTVAGIEKMSQTANVSIQATNNITLDLGGDTIDMTNNRNLTLTAGNDILSSSNGSINTSGTGSIALNAGRDINLSNNVNLTATGTGNVSLIAANTITESGGGDITTQGGTILFNSDRDASAGGGAISLGSGTSLVSNGGNITMGGGSGTITAGSGFAIGNAGLVYGVNLGSGSSINSGSGNVTINGTGYAAGTAVTSNHGVVLGAGSNVATMGNGSIVVNGIGGNITGANGGYSYGISLEGNLTTQDGAMTFVGQGITTASGWGIELAGTNLQTTNGAISLSALTGTGIAGMRFFGTENITATGTGTISFTAPSTLHFSNWSAAAATTNIRTTSGVLDFTAGALNMNVAHILNVGNGSTSGNITYAFDGILSNVLNSQTTGITTFKPYTDTTSVGIAGGAGALGLPTSLLNTTSAGQLNIGRSDGTGLITVAANTWTNRTNLINGTNNITFTGAQTMGANLFSATTTSGNITLNAGSTITSTATGNAVTLDSGTGTFTNNAAINTGTGNLSITADNVALGANLTGTGALTLKPSSSAQLVNLNSGVAGFSLDTAEIGRIQPDYSSVQIGAAAGSAAFTVGAATWTNPINLLNGTGGITFAGAQNAGANNFTARTAGASDITLNAGATITSTATGNAITLAAGRNFLNTAGPTALNTPSGRWLIYSTDPSVNVINGLVSDFSRYGCTYGGTCPAFPATGNGVLFSMASLGGAGAGGSGGGGTSIPFSEPVIEGIPIVPEIATPAVPPATGTPTNVVAITAPTSPIPVVQFADSGLPISVQRISIDPSPMLVDAGGRATAISNSNTAASTSEVAQNEDTSSTTQETRANADNDPQNEQNADNRTLSMWDGMLTITPELARRLDLDPQHWQ